MNYQEVHKMKTSFTKKDPEFDKRVQTMASRTWDVIAYDCLVNKDGQPDESMNLRRSHVIELVMDADHMFSYGNDPEAYAYFLFLCDKFRSHLMKVMKEAFPYKTYGY